MTTRNDDHCGDEGEHDPTDRRRGFRHLRVGIELSDRGAAITSMWVVDQPVIQQDEALRGLIVRVDVAGRMVLVESFDDPRVVRGLFRRGVGHSHRLERSGVIQISIPFEQVADLWDVRVRVVERSKLRSPATIDVRSLAAQIDEPGVRPKLELLGADLRAHPDWARVAEQLGVSDPVGRFEIYLDAAGEHRWRLRGPGDEIYADGGKGHATRAACERELQWVRAHAATTPVLALDVLPLAPPTYD